MADRSLEQRLRRLGAGWKAVLIFRGLLMWAGLSGPTGSVGGRSSPTIAM